MAGAPDALALELEVERIEARHAAGEAPGEADRIVLARARAALDGDLGVRATVLWRWALDAAFAAADAADRATPAAARDEARFVAAAARRAAIAARLGFADVWGMARGIAGEEDGGGDGGGGGHGGGGGGGGGDGGGGGGGDGGGGGGGGGDGGGGGRGRGAADAAADAVLRDPGPLVARLAALHRVEPAAIRVEVTRGDAPEPGRTHVLAPGRDVRVRVVRRPDASPLGTLRVLLHELGHALLAATWRGLPWALAAPASRADDEGVAAWLASLLEREAFLGDVLGLAAGDAAAVAAAERAARARRRARRRADAAAERAFYRAGGPPPWRAPLAWTDPGATFTYAAAEARREILDAALGGGWPTGALAELGLSAARAIGDAVRVR